MSAQHTPSQGVDAGVEVSLRIGQRVRHRDYKGQRVTGVVRGLSLDSDGALQADIALDTPIVIPAFNEFAATNIYRQHVPAHELAAFDDRDELVAELLALAIRTEAWTVAVEKEQIARGERYELSQFVHDLRTAIAKAPGIAA